jgi:hypothetical protein
MFEISQGTHNSVDYHKKIWNTFHYLQSLYGQRLTQIKNVFTIVVTYSQFDSNICVFYVFLGFLKNTWYKGQFSSLCIFIMFFFKYLKILLFEHLRKILVFRMSLLWFLHVQSTQTLRMDSPYFFQISFFNTNCAPFILKIREDFNIDD